VRPSCWAILGMAWNVVRSCWTNSSDEKLADAEKAMLQGVQGVVAHDVTIDSSGNTVHALRLPATSVQSTHPLVLVHGYGMGAASWSGSFEALCGCGRDVVSIDWPGSGRSTRPSFPLRGGVEACESFFVERIEAWRQACGFERMVLLGHSFGGYFSALYAMRYPQHVEKLILASPVGLGQKKDGPLTVPALRKKLPWRRRVLVSFIEMMWTRHWTPQAAVRTLGPCGRRLVRLFVRRRFQRSQHAGTRELHDETIAEYMNQLFAQPGCAENCLGALLDFGGWAKAPLGPRLLKRFEELGSAAPPVTFLYGEHDWMDASEGQKVADAMGRGTRVLIVKGSGHQMFVENPNTFNTAALHVLRDRDGDVHEGAFHLFGSAQADKPPS